MVKFFTTWTKKKIIICVISVVLAASTFLGAYTLTRPSGTPDVDLPEEPSNHVVEKPDDSTVADHLNEPNKNLFIANGQLTSAGSFRSTSVGTTVSTKVGFSVTQDIQTVRVVKDGTVYKQSASYGLVKMAEQRFIYGETYMYRVATKVNAIDQQTWDDNADPNILNKNGYFNRYGCRGDGLTSYILTDETIVSSSYDGYDEETKLYTFSYELDTVKATPQILYEMRTSSGAKNFPTFEHAKITVTMDEQWIVHSLTTDCTYNVPIAGGTPCSENMTEVFTDIGAVEKLEDMPEYEYFSKYFTVTPEPPVDDDSGNNEPIIKPDDPVVDPEPQPLDVLMEMFETYLEGAPINVAVQTQVKGFDINANLSLFLNLQDLAATSAAAQTAGGIKLTYANGEVLLAVNQVKIKLTSDDLSTLMAMANIGDTSDLTEKFDPSAIMDGMTMELTDDGAQIFVPVMDGISATLTGKKVDDKYVFANATATVFDYEINLTAIDTKVEPLTSDDSYIRALAVYEDYKNIISNLIATTDEDGNIVNKAWAITFDPILITSGQTTYSLPQTDFKVYNRADRIVVTASELALSTTTDNTTTTKRFLAKAAYLRETEQADGRVYLTLNDLTNEASELRFDIAQTPLKQLFEKRLPEVLDAVPQLKQLLESNKQFTLQDLLDFSANLSALSYDQNDYKCLALTVNLDKFVEGLSNVRIAVSQPDSETIKLTVTQETKSDIDFGTLSASVKAETPTDEEIESAYDTTQPSINLDSIDSLLESFVNTAKRKSFRLVGTVPVTLNAIGIKANVELGLDIRIDVQKRDGLDDLVYIAAKLTRKEFSGLAKMAFNDLGGDSYIFYNSDEHMITVMRNSLNNHKYCSKCNSFDCSNGWHTGWKSNKKLLDTEYNGECSYSATVTEEEFSNNLVDYILKMVNFIDTINNAITGAIDSEEKSAYSIDDIIKDYTYGDSTYKVTLDLKPIDSVLGSAFVNITHDESYNLTSLYGSVKLLDMSGVSCEGTFTIDLAESVDGEAQQLVTNKTMF